MKNLKDAEIYVETVFSMESGAENGTWFVPANYATMAEFLADCASWFDEDDPEYLYLEWTDVPDYLIRRDWLCPNIFEIRDALQMLDESDIEQFAEWCRGGVRPRNRRLQATENQSLGVLQTYPGRGHQAALPLLIEFVFSYVEMV